MPEIRLGSSNNAKNINLGSQEIEEVRLGRILVWQNNIAPQIVLTSPSVGEFGDDDFPIGITVASTVNIVFSAQDLDPLDTIVSYAVNGPTGFTPVPTTPITPSNPVTGLTFTIPSTLFTVSGEPTTNNVFTVTVTDQRGKDGVYTVTVINVSVPPPTITVTQQFGTAEGLTSDGAQSEQARWVVTQPTPTTIAGFTPQYSFDNINWINYTGTIYRNTSATCGNSSTVRVYCRSVKTGETTAIGNSASSTLNVVAPPITFNVTLNNCTYGSFIPSRFTATQTCGGVINSAGSTRNGRIQLRSNVGSNTFTRYDYTGTSFPSLTGSTITATNPDYVIYTVPFIIPSTPSTTLSFTCSGGDYRISFTSGLGFPFVGLTNLGYSGTVGTSQGASLRSLGQDFIYTSFDTRTDIASVSLNGQFGGTSATINFEKVGQSPNQRSVYAGFFRLADGGTRPRAGNATFNQFTSST